MFLMQNSSRRSRESLDQAIFRGLNPNTTRRCATYPQRKYLRQFLWIGGVGVEPTLERFIRAPLATGEPAARNCANYTVAGSLFDH